MVVSLALTEPVSDAYCARVAHRPSISLIVRAAHATLVRIPILKRPMARSDNVYQLPQDLPIPVDDGACDHLPGMKLSSVLLCSTSGLMVDLAAVPGRTVVYCYPRTGRPDAEPPQGWDQIPGARGCTPQSCAFRDHHAELQALGADVFGLSTQTTEYQREAVDRLHLPFALLSDSELRFTTAMRLPTF